MSLSPLRIGNFTSSGIAALMSVDKSGKKPGKPYWTYIKECNMERRLQRSISTEATSRPTSWGKWVEKPAFNNLGLEYTLISNETSLHPTISCWAGSPDFTKGIDTVGDIKSPFTLKSYCTLVDAWHKGGIDAIRDEHDDGEKWYWQIVSNAIITGTLYGELIPYVPYRDEIDDIRLTAVNYDGPDQYLYKWIAYANDDELPWLLRGGHYKNHYVMRFEIPLHDKQALTERVLMAESELVKPVKLLV